MAAAPLRAQSSPAAGVETTLYTVPAPATATIATLIVCNPTGNLVAIRVRISLAGVASAVAQTVLDTTIGANATVTLTTPLTLASGDLVRVLAGVAGLAFSVYGQEIT